MSSLRSSWRLMLRRHGFAPLVGAALCLAAGGFTLAVLHPMRGELAQLQARADALQQRLRSGEIAAPAPRASAEEQLQTFYGFFPRAQSAPEWLETMHALGEGYGLQMPTGEYRLERRPDMPLMRYHVTLPVSGSYVQLRQFITHVLQEVPAASLDDVQLRREPGPGDRVDARLRFSIYFGER